jgi:transglutaminase-like putative cysteine protease
MHLKIYHRTEYYYHAPVYDSHNDLKLQPKDAEKQLCKSCIVSVKPPVKLNPYVDLHGNRAQHFEIAEPHQRLVIEARMRVETAEIVNIKDFPYGVAMSVLKGLEKTEVCRPFLQSSPYAEINPEVWRQAVDIMEDSTDVFQTAYAIMAFIFDEYSYDPNATLVTTPRMKLSRSVTASVRILRMPWWRCAALSIFLPAMSVGIFSMPQETTT